MENKYNRINDIFISKGNMANPNNRQLFHSESSCRHIYSFPNAVVIGLCYNIQALIVSIFKKKKMAEISMKWIFLNILGLPIAAIAWWENLDNWKGGAMSVLGIISLAAYSWLTYQKARSLKIDNDAKEFNLNLKKYKGEKYE